MPQDLQFKYREAYCEENVWHLCQHPRFESCEKLVVVITNETRACALWKQRAAASANAPICWDYHVVLLVRESTWSVWDLDTRLGLPVDAAVYFENTFPNPYTTARHLAPRFRIIDANEFTVRFSSDRSHMRDSNGDWFFPPPDWPLILSPKPITLAEYLDIGPASPLGETIGLAEMKASFAAG